MKEYSLNGTWQMQIADHASLAGEIPGSVYSIMLENGQMEDPYYRMNELDAFALMENDCTFERSFETPAHGDHEQVLLHFAGIDTIASIYVNDVLVGKAFNFYRTWEYDITRIMAPEEGAENTVRVEITSPIRYSHEKDKVWHVGASRDAVLGCSHIRKPHCMFGWDWGPRIPDAGIWQSVSLVVVDSARLEDVRIHQEHHDGVVDLTVTVKQATPDPAYPAPATADVRITVTAPDGQVWSLTNEEVFTVPDPQLWWPNGLGDQPLYTVLVELVSYGKVVDYSTRRIGLRVLTIERVQDEWGETFAQSVNGRSYFAMGADYIPEDNIFSRITPERTRRLLAQCRTAHFNSIRVWGGGYYPSDAFYDACDELGLVVWQDMMFACANYPLDDAFEDNISAEIEENVARLRHHASLGLWCGNNEMEQMQADGDYETTNKDRGIYIRMYEHIIPHILKRVDPDTCYWPASPSSGGSFDEPNSPDRGDVHYWTVWHGGVPFSEYRKYYFRYVSEFGFQSFPEMKTIESFTLPEDRNVFSRVMEMHQRNAGANGKILQYLSMTYLYPSTLARLVYASQLLQAEAMRYGVEHWRRNRNNNRCMGAIYWQLNDIWPVASWSSIDYYGRWKATHYFARRFFAPVLLSCEEVCETTTRYSVVQEPSPNVSTARLAIENESWEPFTGTMHWQLADADSNVIESGEEEVHVAPFTAQWYDTHDYSDTDYLSNHFTYWLENANGENISGGSVLFTAPKHYHFRDPRLQVHRDGNTITVTAQAYAKGVYVASPDADMILSDNYWDMEAGERTVEILEGNPQELTVMSVYDIR